MADRWHAPISELVGFGHIPVTRSLRGRAPKWTRMLVVGLGHEIVATIAVFGAFFSGLALGAFLLDRPIRHSRRPALWYALLEVCIGAWACAPVFLIPRFNAGVLSVIGAELSALEHWAFAFVGTVLLLLPATAAMGATLPAMERLVARWGQDGWAVGGLYASNTLGSAAGSRPAPLAPRSERSVVPWSRNRRHVRGGGRAPAAAGHGRGALAGRSVRVGAVWTFERGHRARRKTPCRQRGRAALRAGHRSPLRRGRRGRLPSIPRRRCIALYRRTLYGNPIGVVDRNELVWFARPPRNRARQVSRREFGNSIVARPGCNEYVFGFRIR